jgi:hypothetical protein
LALLDELCFDENSTHSCNLRLVTATPRYFYFRSNRVPAVIAVIDIAVTVTVIIATIIIDIDIVMAITVTANIITA